MKKKEILLLLLEIFIGVSFIFFIFGGILKQKNTTDVITEMKTEKIIP